MKLIPSLIIACFLCLTVSANAQEIEAKSAATNRSIDLQTGFGLGGEDPQLNYSPFSPYKTSPLSLRYQWKKNQKWTISTGLAYNSISRKSTSSNPSIGYINEEGSAIFVLWSNSKQTTHFLGNTSGIKRTFNKANKKSSLFIELNMDILFRLSSRSAGTWITREAEMTQPEIEEFK